MTERKRKSRVIYVAEEQMQNIEGLIDSALLSEGKTPEFNACLRALKFELDKAKVVPLAKIPPDVVRVGSWVEVEDLSDGYVDQYQIVYPEHADLAAGRISLMTPMAVAILGEKAGREVAYLAPSGKNKIRIARVSDQPLECASS